MRRTIRIVQHTPTGYLKDGLIIADQRLDIIKTKDHPLDLIRKALVIEPRGHADMYGGFITPPNDSDAHFGVLFWHKDGFFNCFLATSLIHQSLYYYIYKWTCKSKSIPSYFTGLILGYSSIRILGNI